MKERPILMSAPMVRATIKDRKTQTRRPVKPFLEDNRHSPFVGADGIWRWMTGKVSYVDDERKPRYGVKGDRLWVKETLCQHGHYGLPLRLIPQVNDAHQRVWSYAADKVDADSVTRKWPSIHMPRWASRITLELTADPTPERIQDISEDDAKAEGLIRVEGREGANWGPGEFGYSVNGNYFHVLRGNTCCCMEGKRLGLLPAQCAFRELYQIIHGKGAWELNPWVWKIAFRRLQ